MKSIRHRLLAGAAAVLAVAVGAFATLAYLLVARSLDADLDSQLRTRAFALSRLTDMNSPRVLPYVEQGLELERGGFFLQLFGGDGKLLAKSANLAEPLPLPDTVRTAASSRTEAILGEADSPRGRVRLATYARADGPQFPRKAQFFAQAGVALAERDARLGTLRLWLIAAAPLVFAAAMAVTWLLIASWQRSVHTIEETARQISTQNLSRQRVFVASDDAELAHLAQAFNELLDRLDAAHTTQQRFVADASHELRTPLTILRGEIEVALRRPRSTGEYAVTLQSNLEEIKRLGRLVENLLELARADAGESPLAREPVDLADVIRNTAGRLAPLASARGVEIEVAAPEPAWVNGDAVALERVAFNLIENAINHSPPGESVRVTLAESGGTVQLAVSDTGPGISPEHLPHVFERFYRVDQSRPRVQPGAGLGLAIVRTLVTAHGGKIGAASEVGRGSTFTVSFPARHVLPPQAA